jgi:hypothetical protein
MEDPSIRQGCRRKCQKYAPITKLAYSITVLLYYHHVIQILKVCLFTALQYLLRQSYLRQHFCCSAS